MIHETHQGKDATGKHFRPETQNNCRTPPPCLKSLLTVSIKSDLYRRSLKSLRQQHQVRTLTPDRYETLKE